MSPLPWEKKRGEPVKSQETFNRRGVGERPSNPTQEKVVCTYCKNTVTINIEANANRCPNCGTVLKVNNTINPGVNTRQG